MTTLAQTLNLFGKNAQSRLDFWSQFVNQMQIRSILEIGVWKGEFAAHILAKCEAINTYYMLDPWRKLDAWNKPFNVANDKFDSVFNDAMVATQFAASKRKVLRGTTIEMIDSISDESVDYVYIDGDHTLRGIALDLISAYPKVKPGGYLTGDDLSPVIWQHGREFEPTLIFPFAVYFAEAIGASFFALPFNQFLIVKQSPARFYSFTDLTGKYESLELRKQFAPLECFKEMALRFQRDFKR